MVPNTRELLPEPETPVNTVNRRFGISTLTSLRLFTRAPCTRITSWLWRPAGVGVRGSVLVAMLIVSPSPRFGGGWLDLTSPGQPRPSAARRTTEAPAHPDGKVRGAGARSSRR